MPFNAKFELIMKYKNQNHAFDSDLIIHLMKFCDEEARRLLQKIGSRSIERNIVDFGKLSISVNNRVMERLAT